MSTWNHDGNGSCTLSVRIDCSYIFENRLGIIVQDRVLHYLN